MEITHANLIEIHSLRWRCNMPMDVELSISSCYKFLSKPLCARKCDTGAVCIVLAPRRMYGPSIERKQKQVEENCLTKSTIIYIV
jgi:hypothetical protein